MIESDTLDGVYRGTVVLNQSASRTLGLERNSKMR